jgi:uncharacterized delta-60 repeat protein
MGTLALDRTFKQTGILIDNVGNDDTALGVVIQSDGKIVTTGVKQLSSGVDDFYLRRYNRDGSADLLFNSNAISSTPPLSGVLSRDSRAIIQQGNAFYVIGNVFDSDRDTNPSAQPGKIFIAKYASDGVLQQSFSGGFITFGAGLDDYEASAAVIQSDGKILVTGSVRRAVPTNSDDQDIILVRFTSNGVLDTTFGEVVGSQRSGKITSPITGTIDVANSVKIQRIGAEDRIVVVGSTGIRNSEDFILARYTASGDLDSSFGTAGISTVSTSSTSDIATDFIVLADNKILVVGSVDPSSSISGDQDIVIARYLANGTLDTTFGPNNSGRIVINASSSTPGDDFAVKIVRDDRSGKILVLGAAQGKTPASGSTPATSTGYDAALVRLNSDGTLDTSFGNAGVQLTPVGSGASEDLGLALAISPQDSSVVIVGDSKSPQITGQAPPNGDSFIVKYVSDQTKSRNVPDFNGDGKRDFIWRNSGGTALTWFMDGTSIISSSNVFSEQYFDLNWKIVSSGDFNKDGSDDLLWRNIATGVNQVWFMNGTTKIGQQNITRPNGTDFVVGGDAWRIKATGDFNKDGVLDIVWRNSVTGENLVWYLGGAGGTVYQTESSITPLGQDWDLQTANDFNLDGTVDIFWRNTVTGSNAIWYLGGPSGTTVQYTQSVDAIGLNWNVVGSGDFNNDGGPDLLWRNSIAGGVAAWNLGDRRLSLVSTSSIVGVGSDWTLLSGGDFNGDGKKDFIWRNSGGTALTWFMDGTSIISSSNIFSDQYLDLNWKIISAGDFNKDGSDDLLWRNTATGINQVWFMNGTTKIGQQNITRQDGSDFAVAGNAWQIKASADFNKDGALDIVWRNSITGENLVWYLGGASGTVYQTESSITSLNSNWDLQTANDFNLDGTVDVFWRNTVTGSNAIWYLGGPLGTTVQYDQTLDAIGLNWNVVGSGDFNNDGGPDLLWRNSIAGGVAAWNLGDRRLSLVSTASIVGVGADWTLL